MSDDLVKRLRDWEHVWPDDMNKPAGHLYEDAADRIEELEAKLALTEPFVRDFVFRAKTSEHTEDDIKLLSEDNLRFERDCDITKARGIIAELTGGKDD